MKSTSDHTSSEQIEKESDSLKKPEDPVSSESSNDSGKKSKTDSWTVNYLKTKYKRHDSEAFYKPEILELCEKRGIKTISEFYDLLCKAWRNKCNHNLWGEKGPCWDSLGDGVAFGLDEIKEAFDLEEPTCLEICKLGCCARVNQLLFGILEELYRQEDEAV